MKGCIIFCPSTEGADTRYLCWLQVNSRYEVPAEPKYM